MQLDNFGFLDIESFNNILSKPKVYTIYELSRQIKESIEKNFGAVSVRGEISGFKLSPQGHGYFVIKDEQAVLRCVVWKGTLQKMDIKIEDGIEVICTGNITTYPMQSNYQLTANSISIAGEGALLKLLEKRKAELSAQGLFDQAAKKPIPFLPTTIGVITSPTGAVIKDILHRVKDRFPGVQVLIWGVLVQGPECAKLVSEAINGFQKLPINMPRPDVLIIARGGGSIEDLWGFNEEIVVRAAYNCKIPIISAIGHEVDHTLLDLVADLRAPTPTAAAEKAVPVMVELKQLIASMAERLNKSVPKIIEAKVIQFTNTISMFKASLQRINTLSDTLEHLNKRLKNGLIIHFKMNKMRFSGCAARLSINPIKLKTEQLMESKITLNAYLNKAMEGILVAKGHSVNLHSKLLESYNYKKALERGFAVVYGQENQLIKSKLDCIALNDANLRLEFYDGSVIVKKS